MRRKIRDKKAGKVLKRADGGYLQGNYCCAENLVRN